MRSYFAFPVIPGQNPWLDLMRALAVLLVLARHGERALTDIRPEEASLLHTLFMNGWVGVDLFFVLSGYLITSYLLRSGPVTRGMQIAPYLMSRALRILPAYYAVLALTAAGAFPLFHVSQDYLGLRIAYHILLLQDYLPANINGVLWSLGVEEKFYILAPFILRAVLALPSWQARLHFALAVLAVTCVWRWAVFSRAEDWSYPEFFLALRSPFHMSVWPLAAGMAIAICQHRGVLPLARRPALLLAISFAVSALLLSTDNFMAEIGPWDVIAQPLAISIAFGLMVYAAASLEGVRMPAHGPVRVLARLSYTLYLVHLPLLPLALAWSQKSPFWIFWIAFLALSFMVAALLHFAVEKPFLLLKDRLRTPVRIVPRPGG